MNTVWQSVQLLDVKLLVHHVTGRLKKVVYFFLTIVTPPG
jgi:hypothetical protein